MDKATPTQEQIKEFWEWCGGIPEKTVGGEIFLTMFDGKLLVVTRNDTVDLNNLLKYVVPKLRDLSENNTLQDIEFHWQGINISDDVECNLIFDEAQYDATDKDPALALFWAIYSIIDKSPPL